MSDEFKSTSASEEQTEVFLDLQRMIIKLYNVWSEDASVAVFAAALGSTVGLIEKHYENHVAKCSACKEKYPPTLRLAELARFNFDCYYESAKTQTSADIAAEDDMVRDTFGGKHGLQ